MTRVRATALVVDGNKALVMHRHKNGQEYYVFPGGGVEVGETAAQAAERELLEETSIIGTVKNHLLTCTDARGDVHELFLVERSTSIEPEIAPTLQANSIEASIADENNSYEPRWVDKEFIKSADTAFYPAEVKKFLINYF